MGIIAIWGMHFIGNRAIIIGDGADFQQILYSTGYTTASCFVPVPVLFIAFAVVGTSDEKLEYYRIILGGILTGLAVCGTHYLGQAGILNYICTHIVACVVGAATIAIAASIIALAFFSYFRSSWDVQWWSKIVCALILATTVSSTHWVASVGTEYQPKDSDTAEISSLSTGNSYVGVIILGVSGCIILLLATLLGQRHVAHLGTNPPQISLAAAVFDRDGRIMVTPEGCLPSRKITDKYLERSLDDVFCISHPLFIWSFRTTFNWNGVVEMLPSMRSHIYKIGVRDLLGLNDARLVNDEGTPIENYSIAFRNLFCIAAADIADDLHIPLEKVGILYHGILSTGLAPKDAITRKGKKLADPEEEGFVTQNSGSGQLLFLAKSVGLREACDLRSAGYRFASPEQVIGNLSRSVQSCESAMTSHLKSIRDYVTADHTLGPGVHLACFSIRASLQPGWGGFEILSRKNATNLLPTMQLPIDKVEDWQLRYLEKFNGFSVAKVMKSFGKASLGGHRSEPERSFAKQLFIHLGGLREEIDKAFFNAATLISEPFEIPCRGSDDHPSPGKATLIVFQIIVPIQEARAPGNKFEFVPLNFFKMQQFVYRNSPDHATFARRTYHEFAPVLWLDGKQSMPQTPARNLDRATAIEPAESKEDRRTYVDELFTICIASRSLAIREQVEKDLAMLG